MSKPRWWWLGGGLVVAAVMVATAFNPLALPWGNTPYAGWLTGLIPASQSTRGVFNDASFEGMVDGIATGLPSPQPGAVIVAYNPVSGQMKEIKSLPHLVNLTFTIPSFGFATVNPQGTYAAYTDQSKPDALKATIRVVSLSSTATEVFSFPLPASSPFAKVPECGPSGPTKVASPCAGNGVILYRDSAGGQVVHWITNYARDLAWFPDGRHLLFLHSYDAASFLPADQISVLDTRSGFRRILAGPIPCTKAAVLIRYYGKGSGGQPLACNNVAVSLASPRLSPNGRMVAYSATVQGVGVLSTVPDFSDTILASSLWVVSSQGDRPKRLFVAPPRTVIGQLAWEVNGKNIVFQTFHDPNGGPSALEQLDPATGKVRTIVPSTPAHSINFDPLQLPDGEIAFLSLPEGSPSTKRPLQLVVNPKTLTMAPLPIIYRGKPILLANFIPVNF